VRVESLVLNFKRTMTLHLINLVFVSLLCISEWHGVVRLNSVVCIQGGEAIGNVVGSEVSSDKLEHVGVA
jgi:hypothetical protein